MGKKFSQDYLILKGKLCHIYCELLEKINLIAMGLDWTINVTNETAQLIYAYDVLWNNQTLAVFREILIGF